MIALENIEMSMIFGKVSSEERRRRTKELLERMEQKEKEFAKSVELSRGRCSKF